MEQIKNFLKISEHISTAGQPTEEQFPALKEAGYEVVVNLAMPTSTNAIPNEGELVTSQGMIYVHLPVKWETPTSKDLENFFHIMEANAGNKVLIHCALNMRVSAFIYLYQVIRQGVSISDAQKQLHHIWQPDGVWRDFIENELANHGITVESGQ